jgi:hypothetical protein
VIKRFLQRCLYHLRKRPSAWDIMVQFADAPEGTTHVVVFDDTKHPNFCCICYEVAGALVTADKLTPVEPLSYWAQLFRVPCEPGRNGSFVIPRWHEFTEGVR